jgi:hypothetical protein
MIFAFDQSWGNANFVEIFWFTFNMTTDALSHQMQQSELINVENHKQ